jgi:hypothetical protein
MKVQALGSNYLVGNRTRDIPDYRIVPNQLCFPNKGNLELRILSFDQEAVQLIASVVRSWSN